MRAVAAPTVAVTWVAISILVGTMLAFVTMISVPSDQLYESIVAGSELGAVAVVFVRWSFLTFLCGALLTWAVVVVGTSYRRARASTRPAAQLQSLRVSRGE